MKRSYLRRKTPMRKTALKGVKNQRRARLVVKNDIGQGTRRIWTTKKADDEFSIFIRERDGKCLFPGCEVTDIKKLQCSHYFGRGRSSTRYDPKNCISLCWKHHFQDKLIGWEYAKQTLDVHGFEGKYTTFMKQWLGELAFLELSLKAKSYMSRDNAIIGCMKLLGKL